MLLLSCKQVPFNVGVEVCWSEKVNRMEFCEWNVLRLHLVRSNGFTVLSETRPKSWRGWCMILVHTHANTYRLREQDCAAWHSDDINTMWECKQSPFTSSLFFSANPFWEGHFLGAQFSTSKLPDLTKPSCQFYILLKLANHRLIESYKNTVINDKSCHVASRKWSYKDNMSNFCCLESIKGPDLGYIWCWLVYTVPEAPNDVQIRRHL